VRISHAFAYERLSDGDDSAREEFPSVVDISASYFSFIGTLS